MNFTWYVYAHAFVRAERRFQETVHVLDVNDQADRAIMARALNHMLAILARTGREGVVAPPRFIAKRYINALNRKYGLVPK